MKPRRLKISAHALEDLRAIHAYISARNGAAADAFVEALYDHCAEMARQGSNGVPRDDLSPGLRMAVHRPYLLFFRVVGEEAVILRILHGARKLPQNLYVST